MMGAPIKDMTPANEASAEALLTTLRTIDPAERRKHASVFNYWLSIRGKRQFPAIRDLDPLEISDAGPFSLLMEMIGGGEDAEIRHLGHSIKQGVDAQRISDVEAPSLLACIHAQLPVVASSRQAFAFEDRFDTPEGKRRCWVTLLPLSTSGTWIDFVYGFVSLEGVSPAAEQAPAEGAEEATPSADMAADEVASSADEAAGAFRVELRPFDDSEASECDVDPAPEPEAVVEDEFESQPHPGPETEFERAALIEEDPVAEEQPFANAEPDPEPAAAPEPEAQRPTEAGFSSKLLAGLASVGGFYGKVTHSQPEPQEESAPEVEPEQTFDHVEEPDVEVAQVDEPDAAPTLAPEPEAQPEQQQATASPAAMEVNLNEKLSSVRAMAEEARQAQQRSNLALYEGLSAAYDFALDAEDQPEDYLRLVEERGLKIQLRSPMKPVVKLAFDGLTDDSTIGQLEAVLSWALKADLPRGSLAERIIAEGGVNRLLANMPN